MMKPCTWMRMWILKCGTMVVVLSSIFPVCPAAWVPLIIPLKMMVWSNSMTAASCSERQSFRSPHGNRSALNLLIRYYDSLSKPPLSSPNRRTGDSSRISVIGKARIEMYISDKAIYFRQPFILLPGPASPMLFWYPQVGGSVPVHDDMVVRLKLKESTGRMAG